MKHILTVNGVDFEVRNHGVREQESYWTVQAEETVPSLVAGQASTTHTYPIAISRGFLVFDMAHPHSVWHDEKKIPLSAFGLHSRMPALDRKTIALDHAQGSIRLRKFGPAVSIGSGISATEADTLKQMLRDAKLIGYAVEGRINP